MKNLLSAVLVCLTFIAPASAKEVAGIDVAETLKANDTILQLNGAGLREKWVFDVYVGGLYLESTNNNANDIISTDAAMAVQLIMLRDVDGKDMADAIFEGFEAALNGDTSALDAKIKTFLKVFGSEAAEGNVYTMVYSPNEGVKISINGEYHSTVSGFDFKKALFAIWLGDKPAQDTLKEAMLGQ